MKITAVGRQELAGVKRLSPVHGHRTWSELTYKSNPEPAASLGRLSLPRRLRYGRIG